MSMQFSLYHISLFRLFCTRPGRSDAQRCLFAVR